VDRDKSKYRHVHTLCTLWLRISPQEPPHLVMIWRNKRTSVCLLEPGIKFSLLCPWKTVFAKQLWLYVRFNEKKKKRDSIFFFKKQHLLVLCQNTYAQRRFFQTEVSLVSTVLVLVSISAHSHYKLLTSVFRNQIKILRHRFGDCSH